MSSATVLLIDPPGWQGLPQTGIAFPNVGLAYIASALITAGHNPVIMDLNNQPESDDTIVEKIRKINPNIIGFSIKTATYNESSRLAKLLKSRYPNIPIIAGGAHVGIAYEDLDEISWLNYFLIGEGEKILPVFCKLLMNRESIPRCLNQLEPDPQQQRVSLVEDLDNLPLPDYRLFPTTIIDAVRRSYPLVTSRGCIYACTYCSVPMLGCRRWRKRSPENIINELLNARLVYDISGFEIIDDIFNLDIDRAKVFCRMLITSKLSIQWNCNNGIRADQIDNELAELMARAGCQSVMVGVESGDPAVFAGIQKGESLDDIERGISLLQCAKIKVGGYFIVGLPGDSFVAEERSIFFARRLGINAHFNLLIPYPGTQIWNWVKKNARPQTATTPFSHFGPTCPIPFDTLDFSAAERVRAWEMVNTRSGHIEFLVSQKRGLFRSLHTVRLLWKYDRSEFWKRMGSFLERMLTGLYRGPIRKEHS